MTFPVLGQWGTDATSQNNAPNWAIEMGAGTQPGATPYFANNTFSNNQLLYGNTTANAVVTNQIVSIVGVNSNSASQGLINGHAGWNLVKVGSGPITSITVTAGGSGYTNGQYLTISNSAPGYVSATANVLTNAAGNVVSVSILTAGQFYTTNTSYLSFAVANGSSNGTPGQTGATFGLTFGGRAGRKQNETLIALVSMTGNTGNPFFPNVQ